MERHVRNACAFEITTIAKVIILLYKMNGMKTTTADKRQKRNARDRARRATDGSTKRRASQKEK